VPPTECSGDVDRTAMSGNVPFGRENTVPGARSVAGMTIDSHYEGRTGGLRTRDLIRSCLDRAREASPHSFVPVGVQAIA